MAKKDKKKVRDEDIKSRGWCFTVHAVDDDSRIAAISMYDCDDNATYLVMGDEICTRTDALHLQCYIYYGNALRWNEMKSRISERGYDWHFEPQRAKKNAEAYVYCFEDEKFIEIGYRPRQGNRNDLEAIKHDIQRGVEEKDIAHDYFSQWCQYRRAFTEYREIIKEKYDTKLCWYDRTQPMSQLRIITTEYRDYYIVRELIPWLDVCMLSISGKYRYIFVPNFPGYSDYLEDVELSIIKNSIDIRYGRIQEKEKCEKANMEALTKGIDLWPQKEEIIEI